MKGYSLNNRKKKNDTSETVKVITTVNEYWYAFKTATVEQVMGVNGLLLDTGATTHIFRERIKFFQFNNCFVTEEHTMELADGSKSHAAVQHGFAVMQLQDSTGRTCSAKLKHAPYVPSYLCNIFSVHQAVHNGSSVLFEDDRTVLKTTDGTVFEINMVGELYYLPIVDSPDDRAKAPIQMVHLDLASQIAPTAHGGFRYAICFQIDYSGFVSHYFMRNKSDPTRTTT